MAKPFDLKVLKATRTRIGNFQARLDNASLKELIGKIKCLPSTPKLYFEIIEALQSSTSSAQTIADIIARDPG